MPKFTPGPWELRPNGVVYGGPEKLYANGLARSQIAMATGSDFMGPGEQQANAQLMAAAPDLLAALKQAHMALIGYLPQHRNEITSAAIRSAVAAIDKATE